MIALFVIYTSVVIVVYAIGDPGVENGFDVTAVIDQIFPNAPWVSDAVAVAIAISILTATNSYMIAINRSFTSLSEQSLIYDPDKKYLKRKSNGLPINSAWAVFAINAAWFVVLYLVTAFLSFNAFFPDLIYVVSEFAIIITFTILSFVFIAGIWNRKSQRVKVEKSVFFIPTAIISIAFIWIVDIAYIGDLLVRGGWYNVTIVVLIFVVFILAYFGNNYQINKLQKIYHGNWADYQKFVDFKKQEAGKNINNIKLENISTDLNLQAEFYDYKIFTKEYPVNPIKVYLDNSTWWIYLNQKSEKLKAYLAKKINLKKSKPVYVGYDHISNRRQTGLKELKQFTKRKAKKIKVKRKNSYAISELNSLDQQIIQKQIETFSAKQNIHHWFK